MAFTYDPTTDRGRVRRTIGDRDTVDSTNQVFTDGEIDSFLTDAGDVWQLAAALALEAMAADQLLILKVVDTLGLKTDGAKVADAWQKRADAVRAEYDRGDDVPALEIAEIVTNADSYADRLWNEMLREGGA